MDYYFFQYYWQVHNISERFGESHGLGSSAGNCDSVDIGREYIDPGD